MSGRPILQEPFNLPREFGDITRLERLGRLTACKDQLNAVLQEGTCFKHCFELHTRGLNRLVAELCSEHQRYCHIVLIRQDEVRRICSLYLALQTKVWGKRRAEGGAYEKILSGRKTLKPFNIDRMLAHMAAGLNEREWLLQTLKALDVSREQICFETVFAGQESDRLEVLRSLHRFLGLPFDTDNQTLKEKIFSNKQGSERLFPLVPNYIEARDALQHAFMARSNQHS